MANDIEIMAATALFNGLDEACIREIHGMTRPRVYDPGSRIIAQGAHGQSLLVILQGRVEVARDDEDEPLTILSAPTIVGEMAIVTGEARSASVIALDPVRARELTAESVEALLEDAPSVVARLMRNIAAVLAGRVSLAFREIDRISNGLQFAEADVPAKDTHGELAAFRQKLFTDWSF